MPGAPDDWPVPGGSAAHSWYNAGETRLVTSTFGALTSEWVAASNISSYFAPTVSGNMAFVGAADSWMPST